jgi:predicted metal-binding membrane protein
MSDLRLLGDRVATALRWRPEWPVAVAVAATWLTLLAGVAGHGEAARSTPLAALPEVTLMAVAMMIPVALPSVRHVALNSVRSRRQRAMALYVVTYLAVWCAFGLAAVLVDRLLRTALALDTRPALVLALAVAAAWQLTGVKRRTLAACRRTTPLPPAGLRADAGCVRFALRQAWRCVRSCWALMAVVMVTGHLLPLMIAVTALIAVEELTLLGRRLLVPSAAVLALVAAFVALGP